MSSEWIYRPDVKNTNTGVFFRHIMEHCKKHGLTEFVEIQTKNNNNFDLNNSVCRACCRDVEKIRAKQKHQQENRQSQPQKSKFFMSSWND